MSLKLKSPMNPPSLLRQSGNLTDFNQMQEAKHLVSSEIRLLQDDKSTSLSDTSQAKHPCPMYLIFGGKMI